MACIVRPVGRPRSVDPADAERLVRKEGVFVRAAARRPPSITRAEEGRTDAQR